MKLIAIDLDGTLLSSDGRISNRNREVIRNIQRQGHIVSIASGRSLHDTIGILQEAKLQCPIIAGNGAIVYYKGKILQNLSMPDEMIKEMITKAEEMNLYFELYTNNGVYIEDQGKSFLKKEAKRMHEKLDDFPRDKAETMITIQFQQKGFVSVPSYHSLDYASLEIYKVFVLSFDKEKLTKLEAALTNRKDISITTSGKEKLEIGHPETSKGNALKYLASYLVIPLKDTVVMGDNLNDLSMFQVAGKSIAMGNAVDEVKEKASFVTKHHDEDGVAYGLEKFVLEY
ncbi:Cof-type HAD-IIB family hydrolase [Oceanobacillus halophilus]|uniref:HAD family phosphatase n=1 Tax=Oceanobacillus halophilus TaxID=930130 RepID=A0A495A7X1_9BACI|nr:Cof-type HAD-IIB family hydrolase [Oceanobacillus halophilus]RKQ35829.1 HAD family phosphatase [Oceanobacillus halophilus]